jgi:hypothetical protein
MLLPTDRSKLEFGVERTGQPQVKLRRAVNWRCAKSTMAVIASVPPFSLTAGNKVASRRFACSVQIFDRATRAEVTVHLIASSDA